MAWLKEQINETWERRDQIEPKFDTPVKPRIFEILKLLPRTNCRECAQATCLVFASLVSEGVKGAEDCPSLTAQNKMELQKYLEQFSFVV